MKTNVKHIMKECLLSKGINVIENIKVLTAQEVKNNSCNAYTFAL